MAIVFQKGQSKTAVQCYRQLNLLAHAQIQQLDLGSECGGHGVCGKDRILVPLEKKAFLSPPTSAEQTHFSSEQLAAGWRLGCQCFPARNNIEIIVKIGD